MDPLSKNSLEVISYIETHWKRTPGLIVALVLAVWVTSTLFNEKAPLLWLAGTEAFVIISVCIVWHVGRRIPRTKRGCIGFLVSIVCEDTEESKRIRADFISPLEKLLKDSESGKAFHFIEVPNHLAESIKDRETATAILHKTRSRFMLYGTVKRRIINGEQTHVLDLDGLISHRQLPPETSRMLSLEFGELLPRKVQISEENDLFAFEFTSKWAGAVARYIIGISSATFGDLDYAEQLYNDAIGLIRAEDRAFPIYKKLSTRIPERLCEIHIARANEAFVRWCQDHSPDWVADIGRHLQLANGTGATQPIGIHILSAIHAFLANRDVATALQHLKKVKYLDNALWHLNRAFLLGYKGDLKGATREYKKASLRVPEQKAFSEVEEFMCWVIDQEPEQHHLYYCLGVFNWQLKGDAIRACDDFETFLRLSNKEEHSAERQIARDYISETRRTNG